MIETRYFLLVFLLLFSNSLQASPASWELEIIYPSKEKKVFPLSDGESELKIEDSKIKCHTKVNSDKLSLDCERKAFMLMSFTVTCLKGVNFTTGNLVTRKGVHTFQIYCNRRKMGK